MPHSTRKAVAFSLWLLIALFAQAGQVVAQTTASYAGTYSGTYAGGDKGSFTAVIASSGTISVSGTGGGGGFTGSGTISSIGDLTMTVGSTSAGSTFTGKVNATTGALSGTWINSLEGVSGGFSGTRTSSATTTTSTTTTTTTTVATTTTTTLADGGASLNLQTGWNLLGNSSSATIDVASTFGDTSKVTTVWKWVRSTSKWALYAPSLTPSALATYAQGNGYDVLTSLAPRDGFWVNAKATATLSGPIGAAVTLSQADLQQGWNLVSSADGKTPSQLNLGLSSSLAASSKALTTLWGWDPTKANWKFYAPSLEGQGGTALTDYIAGKNYLAFGSALSAAEGFWINIGAATAPVHSAIAQISSGGNRTFAVLADGSLWGWGSFDPTPYSDFDPNNPLTYLGGKPRKIGGPMASDVKAVSSGKYFSMALKTDGTLWAWGPDNCYGQLGIGPSAAGDSQCSPPAIRDMITLVGSGFSAVAASDQHTIALKADGTLWAWGSATTAGAGARSTNVFSPIQIGSGFASIAVGPYHSMAVKTDGTLWGWGLNSSRQIMPNSSAYDFNVPTLIGSGYKSVAAGDLNTLALKTDGTLWAWGTTTYGVIGDGVASQYNSTLGCECVGVARQVGSGFSDISLRYHHALALKSDGGLWAWGTGAIGDGTVGIGTNGDGSNVSARSPKQVGSGHTAISAGYFHSMALGAAGVLYAWGSNNVIGLGGYNTSTLSPAVVVFP